MTSPDDPENDVPKDGDKNAGSKEDELNLAYLAPHARQHYGSADERIQNALAHVNPERAVDFLRHTHGAGAGQEALMRALMAERQQHRSAARYWLDVYGMVVG